VIFAELTLLPEPAARRELLSAHTLALNVLRPPYPVLGIGSLRILRVRETGAGALEIVAGYDNYQRLDG
jgi:hypothetical protein